MASIDLSDLIEDLKAELNVPGQDSYPDATDTDWVNQLRTAFWETMLDGLISSSFEEQDGIVTNVDNPTVTLSREMQQLVIFYAGVKVVRNQLRDLKTVFRAVAGPVEYETQQSAQVLKTLLDELTRRRNFILTRLSDMGTSNVYIIDMVEARDYAINNSITSWIGS